jgi:3-methyladenine DNA glycosylase Mpg
MHTFQEFKGTTFVPCPGRPGGYVVKQAAKAYRKKYRALLEGDRKMYKFMKFCIMENNWCTLSSSQATELTENYPQYFRVEVSNRHPKIWKFVRAGHKLFLTHVEQLT